MFRFTALSDTELAAEAALFNQDALDLLHLYGPDALHRADYQRVTALLSTITHIQQQRAARAAQLVAA